jgi:hypothetical protein
MQFMRKMLGLQEIRDAVKSVVVDQDRAEQGLLGLDILRRRAAQGFSGAGFEPTRELLDGRHGCFVLIFGNANADSKDSPEAA